jgi:ribulose-5-phosphate 4-epimerase/fuculose-1-phosphate aldolase
MQMNDVLIDSVDTPGGMDPREWEARQELACAYRLFDHFGWHELIYNHITVRVPGSDHCFLINPFGLLYREVTASNLVKIDIEGNIVGESKYPVNPAGFVVHSAVHAARKDAHAVAHTHTTAGQAVSCHKEGLLPLSFTSTFFADRVAYHDFEGITLDPDERQRLAADLGDKPVMILRNHGLLACGPTLAHCFTDLYHLQRACEVQVAALAGGAQVLPVPKDICLKAARQHNAASAKGIEPRLVFEAMKRMMFEKDPSYLR